MIFAYQLAKGMEYIHSCHLLHRDLAARNVLLCNGNILKITDFGLAKDVSNYDDQYLQKSDTKVPMKWLSPESIRCQIYNQATDVWSFGVLLWELFSLGDTPYHHLHVSELLQELDSGYRLRIPEQVDDDVMEYISRCWNADPESRCNFMELTFFFASKISNDSLLYYENCYRDVGYEIPQIH